MARIFLIADGGDLVALNRQHYPSEDHLQDLLARFPGVLPGDEFDPITPRRWLLVSREAGIPGEKDGGDRWSLDHLFLDQDGVPTLVEVKRSSDTRLRREVVGQMLDYAANGVTGDRHGMESGAGVAVMMRYTLRLLTVQQFWKDVIHGKKSSKFNQDCTICRTCR